ncbi:hypothetical protein [Streptomyces noursei]|uniref:hypothetical protein n=1 Tax=Streptomyces noursei TaxID=1971 RepID=UPI001679D4DE|nr:hypothetical protein [Streptomyces noursei]MCZ1014019.1 hypothetical protein [Streptomyces noursei]GGX49225.1 hypothetical protein GCM10010341_83590 [Streptomyces noursei]
MTTDHRPLQLVGEVSAKGGLPDLVRAVDGEPELRFTLSIPRWRNGRLDGRDYHRIVLRNPGTGDASAYARVLKPGRRLHVHGVWRTRVGIDGAVDELVVTRLWTPLPIPAGTPVGQPREGDLP